MMIETATQVLPKKVIDWESLRTDFPMLHQKVHGQPSIYFDNAATSQKPGDQILLTEMEHHSNIVPWQMLAERTGAKLVYVPVTGDEGLLDLSKLDSLLTKNVKLFAMVHISNSLGTVNPVTELCERARG